MESYRTIEVIYGEKCACPGLLGITLNPLFSRCSLCWQHGFHTNLVNAVGFCLLRMCATIVTHSNRKDEYP